MAIDPNSLPRDSETLRKIVVDLAEQLDRSIAGAVNSDLRAGPDAETVLEPDMVRHALYQQGLARQEHYYELLMSDAFDG